MDIKKVVMPGVAPVKPATPQPVGVPVIKPVGVQQVIKPVTVAPQPIVTPQVQPVQPMQSVTSIPKNERIADIKNAVQNVKANSKVEQDDDDDDEKEVAKTTKSKKKKFTGPRKVIVYGRELFVEENPDVTLEQIRERIVNEYEFPEFAADRTIMSLDEATGIVVPVISFQKKG